MGAVERCIGSGRMGEEVVMVVGVRGCGNGVCDQG
jgi:hypothetical protein